MCTSENNSDMLSGLPELCSEGLARYREAVHRGNLPTAIVTPCLRTLGLMVPASAEPEPDTYVPVPPELVTSRLVRPIEELIDEQRTAAEAVRRLLVPATAFYAGAMQQQKEWLTVLTGERLISEALAQSVASCREELLTAQPGGGRSAELLAEALERDLPLLRSGVRQRTLYQHSVRYHPPTLDYVEQISAAGAEVRTLDELFERLIICDDQVAYLPGAGDRRVSAVEVRHPAVIAFLRKVFESGWDRAVPLPEAKRDGPSQPRIASEVEQVVIRMLISGHTDDSIARRLGVSRRTAAEHVRRLSSRLGSTSRAQLGYLLATSGMVAATARREGL